MQENDELNVRHVTALGSGSFRKPGAPRLTMADHEAYRLQFVAAKALAVAGDDRQLRALMVAR